jgi:hypothetical protein
MTRTTSAIAYHEIRESGLLSKRRLEVYEYLYQNGPMIAAEIPITGAWKRLSELKERGVAHEVGEKKNALTGHLSVLWDVNEALPSEPPKKEKTARGLTHLNSVWRPIEEAPKHGIEILVMSGEARRIAYGAEDDGGNFLWWCAVTDRPLLGNAGEGPTLWAQLPAPLKVGDGHE